MQVMVQMFDSLYRDRRDELDHLRNVTRELQGLQEMLAKSLSGGAAAPLTTPPSTNGSLPLPTPLPPRPDRSMPDGTAQPAASAPPEALPTEAIHGWLNERIAILAARTTNLLAEDHALPGALRLVQPGRPGGLPRSLPRRGYTPQPRVVQRTLGRDPHDSSTPKGLYNPFGVEVQGSTWSQGALRNPGG